MLRHNTSAFSAYSDLPRCDMMRCTVLAILNTRGQTSGIGVLRVVCTRKREAFSHWYIKKRPGERTEDNTAV